MVQKTYEWHLNEKIFSEPCIFDNPSMEAAQKDNAKDSWQFYQDAVATAENSCPFPGIVSKAPTATCHSWEAPIQGPADHQIRLQLPNVMRSASAWGTILTKITGVVPMHLCGWGGREGLIFLEGMLHMMIALAIEPAYQLLQELCIPALCLCIKWLRTRSSSETWAVLCQGRGPDHESFKRGSQEAAKSPKSICGMFSLRIPHKTLVGKSGPAKVEKGKTLLGSAKALASSSHHLHLSVFVIVIDISLNVRPIPILHFISLRLEWNDCRKTPNLSCELLANNPFVRETCCKNSKWSSLQVLLPKCKPFPKQSPFCSSKHFVLGGH